LILEDESAAERITLNVQSWERKARAFDQAAEEARRKHVIAYRAALEVEAREEEKLAAAAGKAAASHVTKVKAALAELKDLDDIDYAAVGVYVGKSGQNYAVSRGDALQAEARKHEVRAAMIRYFVRTGRITHEVHELNTEMGTSIVDNGRTIPSEGIEIPESLTAARGAGVSFVGVPA
jgi:hypothetical protein